MAGAGADSHGVLPNVLADMSRRLRSHLASELVVRTAADDVHTALRARSTAVWLTTGGGEAPQLAYATPELLGAADPIAPHMVVDAARSRRPARARNEPPGFAAPLVAPHSGLLGVLEVERQEITTEEERFIEDVAKEAALALETANLFEQALAAKERSDTLLARVADAIVVTDTRGTILEANAAAGWLLQASAHGPRTCSDVLQLMIGERDLDCSAGCALLSIAGPGALREGVEVWRRQPDGRRQPLLASVAPVTAPDGEITELVHSFRDITRLKQADEAKTLFLATASHELKTPLTVIRGFSQLLSSARLSSDAERDEAAHAIERRALQLTRIVERLLLSGRIEAGRVEVAVEPVNLAPIVTEQVEGMRRAAQRTFALTIEPSPEAMADAEAVRTVIDHLLDNAVKYSPDGGPIDVTMRGGDRRVEVVVLDRGIGMDPDQAEHCFDKFWQAESSDVRRFGGTGIGLYIVRSLIEAMNGTITVHTKRGEGSTFTVLLPTAGTKDEQPPPAAEEPAIAPEPSVIREFMRQLGIPSAQGGGTR